MQDRLLLRRFVERDSQAAFAEVVGRYLRLVYSTCLREVGDRQMAEDVTQGVFLILARKAPSLGRHVPLAGWLFRTARLASKSALRQEQRRRRWEQAAAEEENGDAWLGARSHTQEVSLNEALTALRAGEREAILLRFFEEMSFKEVGETLGLSEDAAQKRVSRALEKMRTHLVRTGEALSVAALVSVLSAEAARAVPSGCGAPILQIVPGLKITLEASSLLGSRSYQIAHGVLRTMKAKSALAAASVAVLAVTSASILMAGASKGSIVGTWTGKVPQYVNKMVDGTTNTPKQNMDDITMRFNPGGTFTFKTIEEGPQTHTSQTMMATGNYKLAGTSLTMTFAQQTVDGRLTPAKPKDVPAQTEVVKLSNGGRTLTIEGRPALVLRRQ